MLAAPIVTAASVTDTIANFENVVGSDFADTIIGDDGPNSFWGGKGPDMLTGAGGDDMLMGERGNDTANGGVDSDTCDAETEIDCEFDVSALRYKRLHAFAGQASRLLEGLYGAWSAR